MVKVYQPHPVLRPFVQAYLYLDKHSSATAPEFDVLPSGHGVLVFMLGPQASFLDLERDREYTDQVHYVGQMTRTRYVRISDSPQVCIFFRSTGAFRFSGEDQSDLVNDSYSAYTLLGNTGEVLERLNHMREPALELPALLNNWLLDLYGKSNHTKRDPVARACQLIEGTSGRMTIAELRENTGLSKSALERNFKIQVGVSPKMFSRIIRFSHTFHTLKRNPRIKQTDLLYRFGYFDQPHLIHEFKYFYGDRPSQVSQLRQEFISSIQTLPA